MTRGTCAVALGALLINVVLVIFPWTTRMGALGYVGDLFLFRAHDDSWEPMHAALDYLDRGGGQPLYQEVFFKRGIKFQYPPTALLLAEPLMRLPAGGPPAFVELNVVSWLSVFATLLTSIVIFNRSDRNSGRPPPHERPPGPALDQRVRMAALVLLGLTFYPVTRAFVLGQIQTWINLGAAVLVLAWWSGRQALAGTIVGLMCLIKPHYGLLFVWALVRRQWRMFGWGMAVATAIGLISIARFGLENHLDYLATLRFLSRVGESFYANQSLNGLVNRMLFLGHNLEWQADTFPPFNPFVFAATLAGSLVFIVSALALGRRQPEAGGVTDLSIMLLSITMASSIAWEHHYGITLPMFAAAAPALAALRPLGRYTAVFSIAAYLLVSLRVSATDRFAATHLNFLQSYVFFGATLLLLLLHRLRHSEGHAGVSPQRPTSQVQSFTTVAASTGRATSTLVRPE